MHTHTHTHTKVTTTKKKHTQGKLRVRLVQQWELCTVTHADKFQCIWVKPYVYR